MVALMFCHNKSTRYAAFFQPSQTPDSVITPFAAIASSSVAAQFPGPARPSVEDFETVVAYEGAVLGWAMAQIGSDSLPGRYQIVMRDDVRADTYLVDTVAGRVWTRTTFTFLEGDPRAWRNEPRLDNVLDEVLWTNTQTRKDN